MVQDDFCNQSSNVCMGFAFLCPLYMSRNAVHILYIFLELMFFFSFIVKHSHYIAKITHAEFFGKLFCQFCHILTMFFIALKCDDITFCILADMRYEFGFNHIILLFGANIAISLNLLVVMGTGKTDYRFSATDH